MKRICTTALFLFLSTLASAQVKPYVRGGLGVSRAIGAGVKQTGFIDMPQGREWEEPVPGQLGGRLFRVVPTIGAGFAISMGKRFFVQTEISLEQKGSSITIEGIDDHLVRICACYPKATGEVSSRLTYLVLPVMVGFRTGQAKLTIGPYVGYKLAEKLSGFFREENAPVYTEIKSIRTNYQDIDLGVSAEVSYAITTSIDIDLRYSQSWRSIGRTYRRRSYDLYTYPIYNQSAQLALRYYLRR